MKAKLAGYKKPEFLGKGDTKVDEVRYHEDAQKLYINSAQYFDSVSPGVWNFHIGGYQVLAKYLKDRKGRQLVGAEVDNIEEVVRILAYTIDQMQKIDDLTRDWI